MLAGTGTAIKPHIAGVIGVGLGDLNELGWRWTDTAIYFTHHLPHEPLFSVRVTCRAPCSAAARPHSFAA